MSFEESERFEFFGLLFETTRTECNKLIMDMVSLPQYSEWSILDNILDKMVCSPDNYAKIEDIVTKHESLRRELVKAIYKRIQAL